jgi:riboflavin kinase/FMN adenylyltransferase
MMQHYWSLDDLQLKRSWLTIGSFDGVHLGHQEIIHKLTAGAHAVGALAVVLTFHPHPAVVLGKVKESHYLSTPEERAALLADLGVDLVITHPFNKQVAALSAREFMELINSHLDIDQLWVGYDFALGKGRQGDIPTLRQIGVELGYTLDVIPPLTLDGEVVSSSRIRSLLFSGQVEEAGRLLGRPYRIGGIVVPGDGRGRTIGIPTANLEIWSELAVPQSGVYVCRAYVDGRAYGAVTNIGTRPTFETQNPVSTVEAHILDLSEDLYGRHVQLDFLQRLRDELRFPSVQALIEQIHVDIQTGRKILVETER